MKEWHRCNMVKVYGRGASLKVNTLGERITYLSQPP
jgi:hypothetical protein